VPFSRAYSIPKAAAFSLSQSLRALLAARGVKYMKSCPTRVGMTRDLDISKASPAVARAIFDGVEKGDGGIR